jgi:hypothetical protein
MGMENPDAAIDRIGIFLFSSRSGSEYRPPKAGGMKNPTSL